MKNRFFAKVKFKISHVQATIGQLFVSRQSLKTNLRSVWLNYKKSFIARPKMHLAVLGSLVLIIALIPIIGSIKRSQTSQAAGLQIQSVFPRIGAPTGGDKVIIKGQDFQQKTGFRDMSVGFYHSCGINHEGKAYCWGNGQYNALGNNSTSEERLPVAVHQGAIPTGVSLISISAGPSHTCAIGSNGKAYCWGSGQYGQLGTGSNASSAVPAAVAQGAIPANVRLTQISTGDEHTCAIGSNGRVYCWGDGGDGRLGNRSDADSNVPVLTRDISIGSPPAAIQISVGGDYSCALYSNNQAYCWGSGRYGQLGTGSNASSTVPAAVAQGQIPSGVHLTQISSGISHVCALGSNNKAYCWGNGEYGKLGNNSISSSFTPIAVAQGQISIGSDLINISSGDGHSCAVDSNGKTYCWGYNYYGQLGNNSTSSSSTPVAVAQGAIPSGVTITQISAGYGHACALGSNNKAYCWGEGDDGQLGNNSNSHSSTPVAVAQGQMPASSAGTAVKVDNTPVAARYISSTELEITMPAHAEGQVNISVTNPDGSTHTLNQAYQYYQAKNPVITSVSPDTVHPYGGEIVTIKGQNFDSVRWKQISSGNSHTCALGSNNKAYCWGYGSSGQLGNNSTSDALTPVAVSQGAIPSGVTLTHISTGYYHTCAIASNSKAYCWGNGGSGQLGNNSTSNSSTPVAVSQGAIPSGITLTHISTGASHTCAIASNSKAYCWGNGGFGRLGNNSTSNSSTPVAVSQGAIPSGITLTHISTGASHTCALGSNNKAYCWGYGSSGQLGNNSTSDALTPVAVSQGAIPSGITLTHISTGYYHTCAIASNSKAYCWGNGGSGQLGNNSTSNSSTPVAVSQGAIPGGVTLTQVSSGNYHTCAIASNSKAYCWGNGGFGRLGNNSTSDALTPVAVSQGAIPGGVALTQISLGGSHTCAIGSNNKAYCWGNGGYGELGGGSKLNKKVPVPVINGHTLKLSDGTSSTQYAHGETGGYSDNQIKIRAPAGQAGLKSVTLTSGYLQTDSNTLGGALTYAASQPKLERLQPTSSSQRTVTSVAATGAYLTNLKASDFTYISSGNSHTCALGSNNKAYCWGSGEYGRLGNNSTSNSSAPVAVVQGAIPSSVTLTQILAGYYHTCALGSNGKAYCWGEGGSGRLGNNSTFSSSTPVAVAQGTIPSDVTLTQISLGNSHTCALGSNGKAYCWGEGGSGRLGNNSTTSSSTPVAVSQGAIPSSVTLTQILAGYSHTCALGSNNKAYCWGSGEYGRLGNNSTTSSSTPVAVSQGAIPGGVTLTHISSGTSHTCALGSDNKAYCWGYNYFGQLGNNSTSNALTPVAVAQGAIPSGITLTHISAGAYHTCALGSNNKAYCWGRGEYGRLGNNSTSNALTPVAVSQGAIPSDVTLTQISAGDSHTCATGSNSKAYCWGHGGSGRLGNNWIIDRPTPVPVLTKTALTISFGSGYNATDISLNVPENSYYATSLTLKTPSRPAGQVPVVITNPDGQSNASQSDGKNLYTFYGVPPAPSSLTAAPSKPLGSITLSFKSPSTGGIDSQPNAGNGFSPITDYKIEYCIANPAKTACQDPANSSPTPANPTNWTTHPHAAITSNSTNPLTISISNLNQSNNYLFRVAAINQTGTGAYAQATATMPSYVSLSATANVDINITPIHEGTVSTGSILVDYATNIPTGYSISVKASGNNTALGNGPFHTVASRLPNSARLQPNQWGFRLPNIAKNTSRNNLDLSGYSANTQLVTNLNQTSHTDTYSFIPPVTSVDSIDISRYNAPDAGQRQMIVGFNAAKNLQSGRYTGILMFTMIGG